MTFSDVIVTGWPVFETILTSGHFFKPFFKMAARFAQVTEEEIDKIKEDSVSTETKQATKYGVKIFQDKIFYLAFFIQQNRLFSKVICLKLYSIRGQCR